MESLAFIKENSDIKVLKLSKTFWKID